MSGTGFDQSAVPCKVTAHILAGLHSERLECVPPNDWQAVTLGDIVAATSRLICSVSADHIDQYTFVWGPCNKHSFAVTREFLSEPFLLHSDGTVRCGALLQGHGGGQIAEASDSFEVMVLVRSLPADTTHGGAASPGDPLPLVRGLACVGQYSWQRLEAPRWFDDELCNAFLIIHLMSYDSRQHRNSQTVHTFAALLQDFLRDLGWQGSVQCVAEENCPQQANGYDCGPFMLLMACLLAT